MKAQRMKENLTLTINGRELGILIKIVEAELKTTRSIIQHGEALTKFFMSRCQAEIVHLEALLQKLSALE